VSDQMFVAMIVVGIVLLAIGLYFGNKAPPTRRESCGFTGLLIVLGCILVAIPPVWVLVSLALYQAGLL
jgi:hypothetical protein